jgi:hypothetical protein
MAKKIPPKEIAIRSSAAEYLTFVAAKGDNPQSAEMRYQIERRRNRAITCASSEMAGVFRDIRHFINTAILGDNRVEYGRLIFPSPSEKLAGSDHV